MTENGRPAACSKMTINDKILAFHYRLLMGLHLSCVSICFKKLLELVDFPGRTYMCKHAVVHSCVSELPNLLAFLLQFARGKCPVRLCLSNAII